MPRALFIFRSFSLRRALTLPLLGLVLLAAVAVGGLVTWRSYDMVDTMCRELMDTVQTTLLNNLYKKFEIPHRALTLTSGLIQDGALVPGTPNRAWENHLHRLAQTFGPGQMHGVFTPDGQMLLVNVGKDGSTTFYRALKSNGYKVEQFSNPGDQAQPANHTFDLFSQPWHQALTDAHSPSNTALYEGKLARDLLASEVQRITDKTERVEALIYSAVRFTDLSQLLRAVPMGRRGVAFLMDRDGFLLATSTGDQILAPNCTDKCRIAADASGHPLVRQTAAALERKHPLGTIAGPMFFTFRMDGWRILAKVTPYQDLSGHNWLLLTSMPESDFTYALTRQHVVTGVLILLAMLIAAFAAWRLAIWLIDPLHQIADAARQIGKGRWQGELPAHKVDELNALSHAINHMAHEIRQGRMDLERVVENRSEQLQQANKKLEHLAVTDYLTGLTNRREFMNLAATEIQRGKRYKRKLSLLMIDIDHFKRVNDTYGHAGGDYALKALVKVLKKCTRGTDILARYGGEEFVALLPETDHQAATILAERIRHTVAGTLLTFHNRDFNITISIGVAELAGGKAQPAQLLHRLVTDADEAMYTAKRKGRNQVHCIKPGQEKGLFDDLPQ